MTREPEFVDPYILHSMSSAGIFIKETHLYQPIRNEVEFQGILRGLIQQLFNVWWLGEVPPCRMLKFSTKACGGILPNHCYKPFLFTN